MTGYVRRTLAGGAVAVLAAGLLAGCGDSSATTSSSGSDSPSLSITSPSEGDTVGSSFTVKWDSSESLGEPETGKDHVHVFVDGNSKDYTVVGGDSFEVTGLSDGEHTVDVTLQHADHSSAGADDQVDVTVSGSGGSSPSESDSGGGGMNY
jgi:Bacterial Ig domain